MSALWHVLVVVAQCVHLVWVMSAFFLSLIRTIYRIDATHPRLAGLCWMASEFRPLYLPAVVVESANYAADGMSMWEVITTALAVLAWWSLKDEGDDRWKRRKAKLAEKVAKRGSRLVVVPAGAS